MSAILDPVAMEDEQRRKDCAREDARLIAELFPMDPRPAHIPESEWEKADAEYVARQDERFKQRLALLHELELREFQTSRKDVLL